MRHVELGLLALALALSAVPARAQAPRSPAGDSPEEKRRKLLEEVGLGLKKPAPAAPGDPANAPPSAPPPEVEVKPTPSEGSAPRPANKAAPSTVRFEGRVHEGLLAACRACHAPGGVAQMTRLKFDGDAAHDYAAVRPFVDVSQPQKSVLLGKASGAQQHLGGATLPAGSEGYRRTLQWIAAGATLGAAEPAPAGAKDGASAGAPRPAQSKALGKPLASPNPAASLAAAAAPDAISTRAEETTDTPTAASDSPTPPSMPVVAVTLHEELVRACVPCHRAGGPAAMARYHLTGEVGGDLDASRAFVDLATPTTSSIVGKAAGQAHGGGPLWPDGSDGQKALLAWIAAGAPVTPQVPAAPASPAQPPARGAVSASPVAAATPAAAPAPAPPGVPLHLFDQSLTLNGRFDLNFERRGFRANPFADEATTAFQNYHHFLFLSRQSADDSFTFTAEILSLAFYEMGLRFGARGTWHGNVRAGKLLVPFGTEPLFHQSYGGHAGFDQKVLPPVFATEGVAVNASRTWQGMTFSADLFAVRGHALRSADAVLNLQSDLSNTDDVHPAYGVRAVAAYGGLSAYYSTYFNPLGFGRRLFMQALDLGLWRWRDLPVLDRLVLGAGFLRADVSGGGPGRDYYHFASYWLARVYATDWLYAQYREGLRTFDNERGSYVDERHFDPADGSTHNFAIGARYRNWQLAITYFLNFEKVNEVDDDLFRVSVAYEF